MGTQSSSVDAATPLNSDQWNALLTRVVAPELGQNLRRSTRRYPVTGDAKLTYEHEGKTARRSFDILNVSRGGMTLKGHCAIDADTVCDVVVCLGEETAPIRIRVIHCTGTLGGFKIGARIMFGD